jgi:hypothetical protein
VNSGLTNTNVSSLVSSGTNLFAGTAGGGIFRSTNNGTSWTAGNAGLLNTLIWSIAASGTYLFAGTYGGGVFLSTNSGASWTAVNSGLTNAYVYSLCFCGSYLFAGTSGGGVWRRLLSEMITSVGAPSTEVPSQFALQHNYPDPFNPSTTIKFELPGSSMVRLSVYDMLGREVSLLVNERRDAGVHEVKFDAGGFRLEHTSTGSRPETSYPRKGWCC